MEVTDISVLTLIARERAHVSGFHYNSFMGLVRCTLQTSCFGALALIDHRRSELLEGPLGDLAATLLQPADGQLLEFLDLALQDIRTSGLGNLCPAWFQATAADASLYEKLRTWVRHRNEGVAHGLVSQQVESEATAWLPDLLDQMLDSLRAIAPIRRMDGRLCVRWTSPDGGVFESPISWLKLHEAEKPILVRRFKSKHQKWWVEYQVLDLQGEAGEGMYELPDKEPPPFVLRRSPSEYQHALVLLDGGGEWRPTFRLPNRQATLFLGRDRELSNLVEWWNDPDERICNLFGQGGIGKTSLALEFLHRILEGSLPTPIWRPDLIVFSSFKRTRWSAVGLERLSVEGSIEELVRDLFFYLSPERDRTIHTASTSKLVDRLAGVLAEYGLSRDSLLLVLDNTESLEAVGPDRTEVAAAIKRASKRLGRVLVTSRIREDVSATPIELRGFSEEEGVEALRRFGASYGADALIRAADSRLRQVTRQLEGRPLTLEALARSVGRFKYGIDTALAEIFRQAQTDLGAFLFEDAWADLGQPTREAMILLGMFANPEVDDELARRIASSRNVLIDDLAVSLERSHLGRRRLIGASEVLALGEAAIKYLLAKNEDLKEGEKRAVREAYEEIKTSYEQRKRAQQARVRDRLSEAFRTSEARAAYLANLTRDFKSATSWYEEAIQIDSGNPALLDRFSWFLMIKIKDLERAEAVAREAIRVDAEFPEAHFTLGMILARRGQVKEADRFLARAEALGKPSHLCALQRSRARTVRVEKALEGNEYVSKKDLHVLLEEALDLCRRSRREPETSIADEKQNVECASRQSRIQTLMRRVEDRGY